MMTFEEQWLIVAQNIRLLLQEILMHETKTKEENFRSVSAFGKGERNERRDRLIEFAKEHKLIIANTLFQKPKADTGLRSHQVEKQETRLILPCVAKKK